MGLVYGKKNTMLLSVLCSGSVRSFNIKEKLMETSLLIL